MEQEVIYFSESSCKDNERVLHTSWTLSFYILLGLYLALLQVCSRTLFLLDLPSLLLRDSRKIFDLNESVYSKS
jgi:hypothetical protein